jgi:hypothetical protein
MCSKKINFYSKFRKIVKKFKITVQTQTTISKFPINLKKLTLKYTTAHVNTYLQLSVFKKKSLK